MKLILLSQGKLALVDDADFESANRFKWHLSRGYVQTSMHMGYLAGKKKNAYLYLHCLIMRPPRGMEVDHRNHIKLDCRRENLRICRHHENSRNQVKRKGTSSKYKGTRWHKRAGKWSAQIKDGKLIHLGVFQDEVEAAKAYDAKAKELFGEFAQLNF